MALIRRKADRIIDSAHNAIGDAEARLIHSFTDEDKQAALDELNGATDFLRRAIAARDEWDRTDHDDYEEYPDVPRHAQINLL